jgi:putative endonuclease
MLLSRLLWTWLYRLADPFRGPLGLRSEEEACLYLRRQGYRVVARNYRTRQGELDIVAVKDRTLAFVEVKSRSQPLRFDPAISVTARKRKAMIKTGAAFVRRHRLQRAEISVRYDLITVIWGPGAQRVERVQHYQGIFSP